MKELKVKEWIIDKAQNTATTYNCFIDYTRRNENGTCLVEDGCVFVLAEEILDESEKAVKVRLRTGDVVGSSKGWTLWIPKSQMMEIEEEAEEEQEEEMESVEVRVLMHKHSPMTAKQAEKALDQGYIVYELEDFKANFEEYMDDLVEDEPEYTEEYRRAIFAEEWFIGDDEIVELDGVKYLVQPCL